MSINPYYHLIFSAICPCIIWYKLKLVFITIDESKGKEKKTNTFVIIKANSIKQVLGILEDKMRGSVIDFTIASVTETTYSDVIF